MIITWRKKRVHKKLHILYVAHERKLGGATLSLLALIDEMIKKGHVIDVVVPTSDCPLARELKQRNIKIYPMFFAWWQMPAEWKWVAKKCFKFLYLMENIQVELVLHMIQGKKYDIVHTNSSVTDFGARLAKKMNCKHVWHVREFGDADYNLEYMLGKEETWKRINREADKIVFISNNLMQYFADFVNKNKTKVIYNGIADKYIQSRIYQEKEEVTFLIAGNLNRKKQQMLVLLAAKLLIEKNVSGFKIYIAGSSSSMPDSKAYERELQEYVEKYLKDKVVFLGRVEDMIALRNIVDVELVPSSREAFGRVTVEAMFSGMPVIASDAGANIELIQNNENGLFFETGNYKDLATKMELLIKQRHLIEELGKRAFEGAVGKYTAQNNADLIEDEYFRLRES